MTAGREPPWTLRAVSCALPAWVRTLNVYRRRIAALASDSGQPWCKDERDQSVIRLFLDGVAKSEDKSASSWKDHTIFMRPPRNIGRYDTSQDLKTGSCCCEPRGRVVDFVSALPVPK